MTILSTQACPETFCKFHKWVSPRNENLGLWERS